MTIINVNTNKAYNVILGDNITETAINDYLIGTTINKVLIVSDDIVAPLYLEKITEIFENNGLLVYNKIIANGELSKNTTNYLDIIDTLSNYNFHRLDCIVALGGGVVGDLASFCASTYLRGIHLIQIPTTLLSVIDSSVGGKTAINLAKGKNLLGSFYQPNLVIADLTLLETLPDIQWQNGKGELIKYTLLNDTNLLELCEDGISKNLKSIVKECIIYKKNIVVADEKEDNIRALLNLGHTLGHAIEKLSNFTILHGIAVAMGLKFMVDNATSKGKLSIDEQSRIYSLLVRENILYNCPYSLEKILDNISSDKKINGDTITLVSIKRLKNCHLEKIKIDDIKDYFLLK